MATRSRGRGAALTAELFPFLSVLACVIGTLVLLVILVASGPLGSRRSITLVALNSVGQNVTLRPHYVEVTGEGVVLHPGGERVPASRLGSRDTPLADLLRDVSERKADEYIIVALRPSGYPHFGEVRRQVEGRGIKIGYEPIDEGWKLRIRR
ncbi:hypothetical protein [Longimicrobium terrae]|uniref:Uncharacterized protein n=1 Tax=Longimicrobium terrae TaxID=1639882 RepID=A0A841GKC4_9BACT|nr:hypothetical protein [Longimicrobium terrae]MBB4634776.1 hypothetical protein [Longimicrobium terrae]MBB6069171.1 hypothetical protein [Longimicrobium terrae]NNC32013.1 hypothetical protein [Longimicrobium terrae]